MSDIIQRDELGGGGANGRQSGGYRWTSLIGLGLKARVAARASKLDDHAYWTRNTARLQLRQLRVLLELASKTAFGREHDFARIAALGDREMLAAYRAAVPVRDISGFRESIARMREGGEPDVLWPGLVKDFAQTSGTTAGDKFIPVSKEMMNSNYRASLDIFAHATRFGISLPQLMGGKCLFIGGSTDLKENEHGIRTGDLSGLVTPMIRWPLTEIYTPGKSVALMSDWPKKIEAMAAVLVDQDVRMVSGMPSWGIVLFQRVLELARQRGRAARTLADVWPNWTLFVHGGVKYTPFDPRVRQLWSGDPLGMDVPRRLELYPASEGFVAIQDTRDDPGLRLNSDIGVFYEFVPLEEIENAEPRARMCHEVERGVRYVVVMTTCAGLWRYNIGDVVMFDTIPGDPDGRGGQGPCRLRIVGRHRHFMNAFGENLIAENIEMAVASAAKAAGVLVGEFTAAPIYPSMGRPGAVQVAVEIEPFPAAADRLARFGQEFDASLKSQVVDYGVKRTGDLGMGEPTVTPLPMGSFHAWMKSRGKLGGQNKIPRCANHREYMDPLIAMASAASASPAAAARV